MFGDNDTTRELAEFLLGLYTLEELLELNDLTEVEVLIRLLEDGFIAEPASIVQAYEVENGSDE